MSSSKKITIVDYKCGNLFSLIRILESLNCKIIISNKYEEIINSDRILLPGVGSFEVGYGNLKKDNLNQAISEFIKKGNHLLGICLGMQLLLSESSEFGTHSGLNLIPGKVKKLQNDENIKIPHVGWNSIQPSNINRSPLINEFKDISNFYFTHSYAAFTDNVSDTIATTRYGKNIFSSVIVKNNVVGVQFHPEKSGIKGEKLISNFLKF
ncbi:imidazole glycerol phosphate synthase subunit HisH [Candidatus Pelagibacter bacterium]|nr:imidazole glycerol phosphate synthase subunit HisH [Candidatus Pelagibacter bacterium]MDA9625012.1 imidazole glycerol phosphate synthase subunit HisH [Candidatus Pelagibacter bacterium]